MYKRKNKPDLMFVLTVFVCLGVLVTSTINAAEPEGNWGLVINEQNDCQAGLGEWQACSSWHVAGQAAHLAPQRASIRLFNEQRPALGVIWYYAQEKQDNPIKYSKLSRGEPVAAGVSRGPDYFGLAVRQQYRHFGFSVSLESDNALLVDDNARLYFGLSNNW